MANRIVKAGQIWVRAVEGSGGMTPRSYFYVIIARSRGNMESWLVASFADGIGLGHTENMTEKEILSLEYRGNIVSCADMYVQIS